ncbi:TonB C-terminal domain-containing protein [Rubellicoccus peritrichatus]|uniref:TonB C-terminal domain-containing protein n=1 Tax=Rubellicoccus peritrichatus TaxID=3080537 RepID=A0AAQ3L6W3_9BACT|nr:TonB C-terminal domain-containing protein [Puniceicoccus sp. CR14]WOO40664.1 TonB C-terminal domain-containing protein [Puniceicoccus sp. CR14]
MTKPNSRKGFVISSLLHAGFFGLLGLAILISQFRQEPEQIILTLESPPSDQPAPSQPAPDVPTIDSPQINQIEPVDLPDIPDIPEPEPEPEPEPVAPPPPAPAPPKDTPKPPEPEPEPAPKTMSFKDFQKQHGKPKKPTPRPTNTNTPKPAPRINVDNVTSALKQLMQDTSASNSSEAEQKALLAYIQRLHRQIAIAWRKPDLASSNEWAEVGITVASNGKITGHRVLRKQCGNVFLQSINDAIDRTRSVGPTPSGKTINVKYTFRLTDQ